MPKETAQGWVAVLEGPKIEILNEADSQKGTILKIGKSYLPYDLWSDVLGTNLVKCPKSEFG